MLDVFTDSSVLSLLTLANFRFYLAVALTLLLLYVQSSLYSPDKHFRSLYFNVGLAMFVVTFMVNILLTQWSSAASYRPLLVGGILFDEATQYIRSGRKVTLEQIQDALHGNLWRYAAPAIVTFFATVFIGIWSHLSPPPAWKRGEGIEVIGVRIPNLVSYSVRSIILQNFFINLVILFATIVMFDLVQLANLEKWSIRLYEPPDFFKTSRFDGRFFISLVLGPALFAAAVGKVFRLHYQMVKGALVGYRPARLRGWALLQRANQKDTAPNIGSSVAEPYEAQATNGSLEMKNDVDQIVGLSGLTRSRSKQPDEQGD